MVRVLVVLKGGYPWGFRMQGGGDKPLVVSKVTSTGKAGGAGVRAGCVVKAINGTPTAQLSFSHAHGLTKQGSTLTLEIEDNSEEPAGASLSSSTSICSSNSASTSSTVVAANGHISSRRRADSGGSSDRTREPQPNNRPIPDHDRTEDSGTSVIILETYGANLNILRTDQEEESTNSGAEASEESLPATSDSSLNLSDYSSRLDPSCSYESDDGNSTDHSSKTDSSTETLVCDVSQCEVDQTKAKEKCTEYDLATGALIEYPNEDSEDESLIRSTTFEDLSSVGENGDSLFCNFEEELERVERQYPNLQAKDLLIEEEVGEGEEGQETHTIVSQWACEAAKEGSRCFTITEEGEEEDKEAVKRREKLETTMGQYYSSGSGGGVSRGDMSGSLPSSPRSSEEWRVSMASTATVASTATAGSDDTVAKDMSELSSINSRLSYLDEAQDEVKNGPTTPPTVDANGTLKVTPQLDHKRHASIKDAIDELESIEQAAQTLLQKRQYPTEDERGKPYSGSETMTVHSSTSVIVTTVTVGEKASPLPERKMPPSPLLQRPFTDDRNELSEKSEKERLEKYEKSVTGTSAKKEDKKTPSVKPDDGDHFQKTETLASPENLVSEGEPTVKPLKEDQIPDSKSEVKPPLPPVTGSQPAKLDVKRRCLTRSKELQPYISRESYNDDRVLKELERLRRSYQESDLNDFLDALENTTISDDLEEAFLRQLLADISEDVESTQEHGENSTQLQEESTVETTESLAQVSSDVPAESPQPSPAGGKFEKVKERILERITVRKAGRVIDNGSLESPTTPKEDIKQVNDAGKDDSGLLEASQICRSVTPQSLRPDTPDSKSSRPHTPDVTKGEDNKKGFNITDLLKKGSPKYLRKKYKERKNRKSDLMTTSESESEDPDSSKKDSNYHNGVPLKKETSTESQSSLKGSNRSLTSSQEVKKEVRFDLENSGEKKELEESDSKGARTDPIKPVKVEETTKELHRISGPQLITCEAQQQETVVLREFEETTEEMESDLTMLLPSTVEDINNRAESLLPRLPERPRPPRKKKLIPTSVEELSGELSDNSSSTVNSDGSVKMVDLKMESLKINLEAKEESPPPLPSYEEVSELPETTQKCVEVVGGNSLESKTQDEREESIEISVISENAAAVQTPPCMTVSSVTVALDTTMTSSSIVTTAVPLSSLSDTTVTSSCVATTDGTEVSMKDNDIPDSILSASALSSTATTPGAATVVSTSAVEDGVLVAPLPISSIVSISVAPTPETATLVMYPPRSLPLPVIQESLQEDQVSLPTPNEPRVSLSNHSGSAPVTPHDEEEKVPSLYDNVNPFKEMLEMESKLHQDTVSESPAVINSSVEIQTETVKEEVAQEPETPKNEMKAGHFDLPQEACKSPDLEKTEIVDIDALAALTTEMFRFTEDMDMGVPKKESKPLIDSKASVRKVDTVACASISSSGPEYITGGSVGEPIKTVQHPDTLISTTDSPKPQEVRKNTEMKETVTQTEPDTTYRSMSVKEMATSNTVGVQTDPTKYVRMYDTASQTDTEYETDLETESEMEENGTSKYDVNKWLFRPTNQSKVPLPVPKDPQLQELHKQQQIMIQELQQQTAMQQRRQKEKPEAPPRQFQEKMPLRVVDELKAVLSESEDAAPKLKKVVEPPPRWDSKFSWDDGVWSPGRPGDERDASGPSRIDLPDLPSFKDQPSVWFPGRGSSHHHSHPRSSSSSSSHFPRYSDTLTLTHVGQSHSSSGHALPPETRPQYAAAGRYISGSASPSLGRKEYRKITYEGTSTPQRRPSQENVTILSPEESFAWKDIAVDKVARSPTSTLPKVQNPTVTLLQKKREGQIPGKRPEYLKPDDIGPKYKPDDKLYVIKREYESEDEEGGRRFAVLGPKKVLGVGPTTSDGVPTTLKSGVKSEHQGEWYRRMFDSLHKVKDARYGGYMSEPEGYDSDVCSSRYSTLDRHRQHHYEMDPMTTSLPRNTNRYVHQPGRIEDYIPGYSSLSEKELKKNPDADVKAESQTQEPPPVSVNHRLGSQKMSITHALKESGYESDSTLVFRKREDARRQVPDPRKTSQVYRQIQRGGDIPLTGLQKPNPPKPREPVIGPLPYPFQSGSQQPPPARPESPFKYESGEVNIHYRTPVRLEQKEAIPEEELARRQEEHMKKVYENERRKKYLAELEDIERRRHTDNFTPLQKSPIPLNRYDDDSSLGTMRGNRTPDLKQVAKAMYNFTAQNKRELTFNKGDVVFIRRQIDKNWYEGESRGSVGIFPCNYVEIVPYESIKTLTRKPTEGQARARFNFQAQTSMEMSLSKGELVVLTRRVDENWYEGRIGNRKGIFPVSYVDTLMEPGSDRPMTPSSSPMPRPALPAANLLYNGASSYSSPYSTLGRPESQNDSRPYTQSLTVNTQQEPVAYRALYNYKPQNDDELELLESDIVMVMEKCDDGWFVGTSRRTGLFGTFPGNYVERV